jgi:hypothetical protein
VIGLFSIIRNSMKVLLRALICVVLLANSRAAIWEFDLGGLAGEGILGGNEVDSLPDSFAAGIEIAHIEVPGIQYDDVAKRLEFHVGWGDHPVVRKTPLFGLYDSSGLFGPAAMNENAERMVYGFDTSNGYIPMNDTGGKSGRIHASFTLVDLPGYSVAQQEADLLGSRWYFNIMSTAYETGEIRGQLLRVVPEPEQYALVAGVALVGAGIVLRRRRWRK